MDLIRFPGLGDFSFYIDRVAFSILGYNIYWYGLIISFGILLSMTLALKHCEKFGIKKEDLTDMLIITIPVSIICARVYYVAFKWNDFHSFYDIINIRKGGLAIYGAVLGAILSVFLFTKYRKLNTIGFMDFCAVYLPLGQAIGRWGNFFNQEAFGTNTTLPWGMWSKTIANEISYIKNSANSLAEQVTSLNPLIPVHPTFLYESIWNFSIFILLILYRSKKKFEGEVLAMYLGLYGLGRFFIEGLRTDSLMIGDFRVSQVLALLFFVSCAIFIIWKRRQTKLVKI